MTLRVTDSSLSMPISAPSAEAISAVANLTEFMNATVKFRPTAFTFSGAAPPADCTVSEVVLRSTKSPNELGHRLYKGSDVFITDVMNAFNRANLLGKVLTELLFSPDHGVELVFQYKSPTAGYTPTILWDIDNSHGRPIGPPAVLGDGKLQELPDAASGRLQEINEKHSGRR